MEKCKCCGKAISEYSIKCPNCGANPNNLSMDNVANSKNTKRQNKWIMIFICCFAVSLLVFIASFFAIEWRGTWGPGIIFYRLVYLYGFSAVRPFYVISAISMVIFLVLIGLCVLRRYKDRTGL